MTITSKIQSYEVEMLRQYAGDVIDVFSPIFEKASSRFTAGSMLLRRFNEAIDNVVRNGRQHFHSVDETHNELCVAKAIIENPEPLLFSGIEYEPTIPNCAKSIDFRAETTAGAVVWIDVKTIKPQRLDKWEQFQKSNKEGLFPENAHLYLDKHWLGGELWHDAFTARARMFEYAMELEDKIERGRLHGERNNFVLFLGGEGFYWNQDELEDFVAFYRSRRHRNDDPFSKMETHYMTEKKKVLRRTISSFACMDRPQFDIRSKRINWNVVPPGEALEVVSTDGRRN